MKFILTAVLLLTSIVLFAQDSGMSPFSGEHWGVVLENPETKNVIVQKDIPYIKEDKRALHMDLYLPPALKPGEMRPAVVFLNGLGDGDDPKQRKMKDAGIYTSWPKLVAANGYIGISMESDGERIEECFEKLFSYLGSHGVEHHIDANRLGVYAASANIRKAATYLMSEKAFPGIKAAALYYGEVPMAPYRKDLPVLFVVAELDAGHMQYSNLWTQVLSTAAPWTITFAKDMPHAFDGFSDTDNAKRIILETLSFWKNNLDPVPRSANPPSPVREMIALQYRGDYPKVIEMMKAWFKENPDSKDPAAYRQYGNALMRMQQFAEAETVYKKSIALDPDNKGTYLNMVIISYALDKPKEAEKYLVLYEKGTKPEGFTYGYIGRLLVGDKKYALAEKYFEKAIALGPHPSDYYNLACCYVRRGEDNKAMDNLFKAAERGFNNKAGYESDADLAKLKTHPRWGELVGKLQ